MQKRLNLTLLLVALAVSPTGCGIFFPSHHQTLDYKPIHAAAESGDLATVQDLIEQDPALVGAKDWDNLTPLHLAAFHGHKDVVEFLLAHAAEVNAKTTAGVTPLHMAAQIGSQEVIEVLLAHGADIKAVDSKGWTPMVRAQKWQHPDAAAFLQAHGGHE
ncbi:MAG TPA: ankyrin repeat domain-containing protein [Candidatus Acidoferrum sp.]|jgi:ankyrin repeat protein|nr:ankyrin repeat domain-containing protein [Candidatus Acidoferrum sp.]